MGLLKKMFSGPTEEDRLKSKEARKEYLKKQINLMENELDRSSEIVEQVRKGVGGWSKAAGEKAERDIVQLQKRIKEFERELRNML